MKKTTNANKKEIGQKPGKFTDEEKRLLKIKGPKYILGLKVGSAVLGWAAIEVDANEDTKGVLRLGVRHFEPGVSGNVSRGQDESNALARREARGARKNQARRTQRQKQLFRLLQEKELLPLHDGEAANYSVERDRILTKLDGVLRETISSEEQGKHLYCLRQRALDEDLMPYELGRILYHLSQRRGYKSNRKEKGGGKKKEEELGAVLGGIHDLETAMGTAGARTLGEYFASLNPHEARIRGRWTSRQMYVDEFEAILNRQRLAWPDLLTEELRRQIASLLFYQRPLKSQAHLIGTCDLEYHERRAAWATREAQEFRNLQNVNDLEIIEPRQTTGRALTKDERELLLGALNRAETLSFAGIRKLLGLGKSVSFNLEFGGEPRLKGNVTEMHLSQVFGERWAEMTAEEKKQVVEDWRTIEEDRSLIRRAQEYWKLDETGARWLASRPAPSGYCALSLKALKKILPYMRCGMSFKTAEKEVYGSRYTGGKVYERIPPVREAIENLRNPAVERALSEVRKVMNALVTEHGKPYEVRVELMRELKKPRNERAENVRENRERESERQTARTQILKELGIQNPSRADIDKALLWEECQGESPFTGRRYPFASLFGQNPPLHVTYILPLSRTPDESYQNRVLSEWEEIRRRGNRTPFEAYDGEEYEAILRRVRSWAKYNIGKVRRFELRTLDEIEGFSNRQLNDTRYNSKMAAKLIESLYGGRAVETASGTRQVVHGLTGMLTPMLRRAWGLEVILRGEDEEARRDPREDYRHHAIDALTVALTRPKMIEELSQAAERVPALPVTGRLKPKIQGPWKNFVETVRKEIGQMEVSHRPEHRLTGALHEETNYGRPYEIEGRSVAHLRRSVIGLTAAEIENIVDAKARAAVKAKAAEHGGDLKSWKPENGDWPQIVAKSGRSLPIRKVRVRQSVTPRAIGKEERTRYVALNNNHHAAIFAVMDAAGEETRWTSVIVPLFDAMERKNKKLPVVDKKHPEDESLKFKFSLMGGDTLLLHRDCNHERGYCMPTVWRVRTIAANRQFFLVRANDARMLKEIKAAKDGWAPAPEALRKLGAEKVSIDTLGRLQKAGG